MKENINGVMWRLAVFLTVCLFGSFVLLAIFGEFRFGAGTTYNAEFSNVTGLKKDDIVRIAGVEVGKVKDISVNPDATVRVAFSADNSVVLTEGTKVAIRYDDLFGGRYVALEEGTGESSPFMPARRFRWPARRPRSIWMLCSAGSVHCFAR